jgi:hypothetical protein
MTLRPPPSPRRDLLLADVIARLSRLDAALRFRCNGRGTLVVEATMYRSVGRASDGVKRIRGTTTLVASLAQLEECTEQALAELEGKVS